MKSGYCMSLPILSLVLRCFDSSGATRVTADESAVTSADSTLGEIVVTAQKRSEKLIDVPISITAVSAAELNQTASKNLEQLQGVIPGITIPAATAYGGSSIVIRGTSGSGVFLEDDPVAVYVDGIYQASNSRFGVSDLADVKSLEVVRGPQGTLQGRNATAGAVLVRTADPATIVEGFVRASVETPTGYRVEGAVSLPISDTFRVRFSADNFDEDGWARNTFNGSRLGGERATNERMVTVWQPDEHFSARLSINYQALTNTQASQRWAQTAVNPTGEAENLANPTPFVSLTPAHENYYLDNKVVYNNVLSKNKQRSPSGALELHYVFQGVELISLTGVSSASNVGQTDSGGLGAVGTNGVPLVDAVTGEQRRAYNQGYITGSQVTEELRLQSVATTPFKWLVGAYGSHAIDDFQFGIFNYDLTSPGHQDVGFAAHQKDDSAAAFADATYAITDRLSFTGGVRYTDEHKTFNNTFSVTIPDIDLIVVGPIPYVPPEASFIDTSYRANVNYKVTDDTTLYLSTSRGFKSGGFNAFGVGATPAFQPEYLYSTELGAKSYLWDRRAYVAASAYTNHYDNLQVTAGVPTGGVNIYNAAKASIKGFEVEGKVKVTDQFAVTANVGYTHAFYTKFNAGQGVDGNLIDATGNSLPNTPTWQYYLQGDYTLALNAAWDLHTQASYRWRDKVYFFATNENPNLTGAADGELGARIEATYSPAKLTVALYCRNLTDTRVVTGEQADFAYPVAFFNQPRTLGLQVSKNF
jgi:iron complex outermembrane recepter protein